METIADKLNFLGICFEIVGFIILLPRLSDLIHRRYLTKIEKEENSERANFGITEKKKEETKSQLQIFLDSAGIPFVIGGLVFQAISLLAK